MIVVDNTNDTLESILEAFANDYTLYNKEDILRQLNSEQLNSNLILIDDLCKWFLNTQDKDH